ncbi:MAG: ABC transporter substrate-binding protein [Lachnospiraceae bacterium]
MKRVIALMLAALMSVSLFACQSASTDSTATDSSTGTGTEAGTETSDAGLSGKIVFLTNRTDLDTDGTYDELIAKFNEQYPDVTVEVQSITDYAGELATRMQTDEYGDVLLIPDAVPTSAYPNYFEPLGTVEELSDTYREGYLYSKWYDGQVYGLAYMCTVQGIVYNKAVFEEAGITELPKTPDEFLECLQMIKDNTDAIPYYTNANSGWTLDQWEDHAFGTITGDANYKNNELPHDANAFSEGSSHYVIAKLLYDIVIRGLCEEDPTTRDWEASKLMMNNGEIGCMVLGSWAVSQMKEAGDHPDDVGYMPFPFSIDGKQYATSGTDYCYAINVHSENKEAARAFIDFMVNDSGLALSQGGISLVASDPMPEGLENFADVEFIVDQPATDENIGLLDEVMATSGITLYDNGAHMNGVVDCARGASSQTFEEYMNTLAEQWAAAVQ